ncbi:putative acyl-CoA dehydrogenase [Streptomyces sp. NBRC 110611]|uniref:acyl-CoA dehydrogenase family protein n=1 Tax=Streptomyces sp. NBRC 110611 TaxID=1621259 RepID=UPI00082BB8B8|nr:acyl-CoA dehydrogenase family protein [Streptomyces sp. NBRC 110611]GAU68736.1 putative acyl-CoA dehydrogenase [Streptomyces sp. NBRC 110611]
MSTTTGRTPLPHLTGEHDDVRTRVQRQLAEAVLPHADSWERQGYIDADAWRALGAQGLLGLAHDGPAFLDSAVLLEELGRTGYAGVRAAVGVHAYMATSYLRMFGTDEQRDTLLPAVARGERIAALAISEDGAGTDLRHLSTRAEVLGEDGYRVSGQKYYVANGSRAGFYITLVKTRETTGDRGLSGVSLLAVDADAPGVTHTPQPMTGWRSADVCRVDFDDVLVPADRLVGRRDFALMHLMKGLDFERLVAGLLAVGGVGYCLELLNRFVREHQIKDVPLAAHQAVRHKVAELNSDFELIRTYAYHAAWLHSRGRLDTRTASVLKLRATELAVTAAQACVQYHGARGYLDDAAAARLYRDAMAGTIAAGASELLRDMIFEAH